jgi:hypothetical protein
MGSGYDIRGAEPGVIARGGLVARAYWACQDGRTSGLPYKAPISGSGSGRVDVHCWGAAHRRQGVEANLPRYWQMVKGGAGV